MFDPLVGKYMYSLVNAKQEQGHTWSVRISHSSLDNPLNLPLTI
jgi:hypothetical protein